jgi:hypothetical protein
MLLRASFVERDGDRFPIRARRTLFSRSAVKLGATSVNPFYAMTAHPWTRCAVRRWQQTLA